MFRVAQILSGSYLILALVIAGITIVAGPVLGGTAPLGGMRDQVIGREPVTISIVYGTEKEAWLQAAAEQFMADDANVQGRLIQIDLQGMGSREMVGEVVEGDLQPTVISPASSIQIELLREEWQIRHGSSIFYTGDDAPQPLVITPLVVVAWEERAEALSLDNPDQLWNNLHEVLTSNEGWSAFGQPSWGFPNFGQTNPQSSNSGMQALVLLAYAYHNKSAGLEEADILDTDFQEWFDGMQKSVSEFISSTGTLMENVVLFGPSKYDFVIVYENLAIENIERAQNRWGDIRIYYPPANILSDHPYAILNAPWVSPEQREAAALFRDFLLSDEMQTLALVEYGFRPASTSVAFDMPDSPFTRYADYGVQMEIADSVEVPSARVINELIDLWRRGDYE